MGGGLIQVAIVSLCPLRTGAEQDPRGVELLVFRENAPLKNFSNSHFYTNDKRGCNTCTRSGSEQPVKTGQGIKLFGKKEFFLIFI